MSFDAVRCDFIVPHLFAVKWRSVPVDLNRRSVTAAPCRGTWKRKAVAAMRFDFFPDREADMVAWGCRFARFLSEREGHLGVRPQFVEQMVQAAAAFEQAYRRAVNPETRTRGAVAEKNDKRRTMERWARLIARQLSGSMQVSDADRQALGLNVPRGRVRHVRPPGEAPIVQVLDIRGTDVTIRLIDAERPSRRARPDNATGATIFYRAGEDDLTNPNEWTFATGTRLTTLTLHFDPSLPVGTPIWISAWWTNRRAEHSPSSEPVRVRLGEGVIHPDRRRRTMGVRFEQAPSTQREPRAEAA